MHDRIFSTEQFVPVPRDRVFTFFCTAENLEAITPPWLRFRIMAQTTEQIEQGTEFTYRLKLRGIPMEWRSRILEWQPGKRFVDVQLRGPYARWHHTHTFHDQGDGTVVRDVVRYRLPLGWLGNAIAGWYVDADVRKIFAYRAGRIAELLEVPAGQPG